MIANSLSKIEEELKPFNAKLVVVSKTRSTELILEAYNAGNKIFGENKVQELVSKVALLPKDIEWHMIGHLQRNKVKDIAPFIHLIHGVDSIKLLKEINKQAAKNNRIINCLLQIHIAQEVTKYGFSMLELKNIINSSELINLKHIKLIGLMGMGTNTANKQQIKNEFKTLKIFFEELKLLLLQSTIKLTELSMGMSSDYQLALQEGSTMVRLGSIIFKKTTRIND